jgi:hypothetical protein
MAEVPEKPTQIRADTVPRDGYIITVDGKLKTRYEAEQDATTEAVKLKQRFPAIQVSVYDAAARVYTAVNTQEQ